MQVDKDPLGRGWYIVSKMVNYLYTDGQVRKTVEADRPHQVEAFWPTQEEAETFLTLYLGKPKFKLGDFVTKISGSHWTGMVVGTYSTDLTPEGYCVESSVHQGSVQIYPAKALKKV